MKQLEHLQYYKRVIVSTIIINNKTDERDPKTIENLLICNEIFIHTYTYIYNHRKTHTRKEEGNLFIPKSRTSTSDEMNLPSSLNEILAKKKKKKKKQKEKKIKRKKRERVTLQRKRKKQARSQHC